MQSTLLHTPVGVRDIYGEECRNKLKIQGQLHDLFLSYGYSDIQTPTFEYFDIFNKERGSVASKNLYKFFDREGYTLVLRPDMTPSIARSAAKYFMDENMPIRFCYAGNAFINDSEYQGKLKEFTQVGAEMIGDSTSDADAEMVAMLIETLLKAGLSEFHIEIGQPQFFKGLVKQAGLAEDTVEELRELLENKKYFGVEDVVAHLEISDEMKHILMEFQEYAGTVDMLEQVKQYALCEESMQALERLEKLYHILKIYGVEKYVSFDLSMLSMYDYYSGIVFRAYTYGTGDAIATGGRYDHLLEQFGKNAPAIGFAVNLDKLMVALVRQHIEPEAENSTIMVLYAQDHRDRAIRYTKELREKNKCVMMVRKRSTHAIEEYKAYAQRYHVKRLFLITEEDCNEIQIDKCEKC